MGLIMMFSTGCAAAADRDQPTTRGIEASSIFGGTSGPTGQPFLHHPA
jgi:hypothetical protein